MHGGEQPGKRGAEISVLIFILLILQASKNTDRAERQMWGLI